MNPQIQKTGKKRTFRITGVPLDWDKDRLEKYLAEHGPSGAEVRSLSREINGLDNTGTAIFQDEDINHPDNNRWEIPLPRSSDERSRYGPDRPLVLDDGFIGLTPLFSPLQEDHKIE